MDKNIQAEVTFENSGEFEFADYSNDVNDQPSECSETSLKLLDIFD